MGSQIPPGDVFSGGEESSGGEEKKEAGEEETREGEVTPGERRSKGGDKEGVVLLALGDHIRKEGPYKEGVVLAALGQGRRPVDAAELWGEPRCVPENGELMCWLEGEVEKETRRCCDLDEPDEFSHRSLKGEVGRACQEAVPGQLVSLGHGTCHATL